MLDEIIVHSHRPGDEQGACPGCNYYYAGEFHRRPPGDQNPHGHPGGPPPPPAPKPPPKPPTPPPKPKPGKPPAPEPPPSPIVAQLQAETYYESPPPPEYTGEDLLRDLLDLRDFQPNAQPQTEFEKLLGQTPKSDFERLLEQRDYTPPDQQLEEIQVQAESTAKVPVTALTFAALASLYIGRGLDALFNYEARPQARDPRSKVVPPPPDIFDVPIPAAETPQLPPIASDLVPSLEEQTVTAPRTLPLSIISLLFNPFQAIPAGDPRAFSAPRPVTQPNPFVSPLPSPRPTGIPLPEVIPAAKPQPSPSLTGVQEPVLPSTRTKKKPAPETRKAPAPETQPQPEECPSTKTEAYKKKYGCEQGYYRETATGIVYKKWSTRKCPSSKANSRSLPQGRPITS